MSEKENELLQRLYSSVIQLNPECQYAVLDGIETHYFRVGNMQVILSKNVKSIPNSDIGNATYELRLDDGQVRYRAQNEPEVKQLYSYLDQQRKGILSKIEEQQEKEKLAPLEQLLSAFEEKPNKKKDDGYDTCWNRCTVG